MLEAIKKYVLSSKLADQYYWWFEGTRTIVFNEQDIENLDPNDNKLVAAFLTSNTDPKIEKDRRYAFTDAGKPIFIRFLRSQIKFKHNEGEGFTYQGLSRKILGKGAFGKVKESNNELTVSEEGMVQVENKDAAIKIHSKKKEEEQLCIGSIQSEAENNQKYYKLQGFDGAKKTPTVRENKKAYTSMPKVPGTSLHQVLYARNSRRTVEKDFTIVLSILRNLKLFRDKKVVLCDFGTQNIMYDLKNGTIGFVDLGEIVDNQGFDSSSKKLAASPVVLVSVLTQVIFANDHTNTEPFIVNNRAAIEEKINSLRDNPSSSLEDLIDFFDSLLKEYQAQLQQTKSTTNCL